MSVYITESDLNEGEREKERGEREGGAMESLPACSMTTAKREKSSKGGSFILV
jgi:hypothetical protein